MRPRYYLPKQEFRTRGEIMESSAASFVVKIGGRLLPGTLLYLRGGALEVGEGGREGEGRGGGVETIERFLSFREENMGDEKYWVEKIFFFWISSCRALFSFARKMKNKWEFFFFFFKREEETRKNG